jgi:DNA ligase (NAD+)
MQNGHYGIDGLVWTLDDLKLHRLLGETAHHPRYRLAFKFEGDFKRTTIKEIEWNISRQGILTPVAIVDEVELNGAKVSRVTLHHAGLVIELNLKKNDVIEIIRSGDVIPKLSKVILSAVGTSTYPDQCPICSSPTKLESIRLFCSLDQCPGKQLEEMIDFVQKIGIESIGPRRLEEMMKKGILKEIPDLFLIKEEQLYVLDKVKEKMAKKMIFQIEKAKTLDLLTLWGALGIKGSAKNSCEKIIHAGFNTLDKIMKLNKADLMMVEGFAEKSADHFLNSWEEKKRLVRTLKKIGVVIQDHSGDLKTNAHSKEVLNFCITGTLSLPRKDIEKKIIQHGHKLQTQVTKSTNYLVANKEEHSSKYQMALKLSIPIIKEEDLEKIL